MKIFLYSIILTVSSSALVAQNVNFSDITFKNNLLANLQINTNGDSEIQVSEAEAYSGKIDCPSRGIKSLDGIQSFKNLTSLNCAMNQLTSIDISQNTNLKSLNVSSNQLISLDVSKNLLITSLVASSNKLTQINVTNNLLLDDFWIGGNLLTNLDITKNIALKSLYASGNGFTSLDVSKNVNLGYFLCDNNLLTDLDLSKNSKLFYLTAFANRFTSLNLKNGTNTIITYIEIWENPNLKCIQVDDANYSAANWLKKDATASYNTNCLLGTSEIQNSKISVYPNPVKNILNFSEKSNVEIYNSAGQKLTSSEQSKSVDVSKLSKGIYVIILKDKSGKEIQKTKIIKE